MNTVKLVLSIILFGSFQWAAAQSYPSRPIRMVVAFPPGGSTDLSARALGERLAAALGSRCWWKNSPAQRQHRRRVGRAQRTHGYTLFMAATSLPFAGVFSQALLGPTEGFRADLARRDGADHRRVHPSLPASTPAELIAHSRATPAS